MPISNHHAWLLLALLPLAGGCSNSKGSVTAHADQGTNFLAQSFNQAYIAQGHAGEYDVVLIQDPAYGRPAAKGNTPLQPMTAAQLRQIVHIHIFWQADGGSVARDGVVTNAAIDWYVIAHEESDRPEILRYEGAGYVLLDEGRKTTSVEIRDGNMKQRDVRGSLKDPIGPSHLKGVVKAQPNREFVRNTLADLKATTAGNRTTASALP